MPDEHAEQVIPVTLYLLTKFLLRLNFIYLDKKFHYDYNNINFLIVKNAL